MGKNSIIGNNLRASIIARDQAKHRPEVEVRMVKLDDIILKERFRKDLGDIAGLATSIETNGLINPITLLPDLTLVAGGRRLAAFRLLHRETIPARIIESLLDAEAALKIERDENTQRKDFTPLELKTIVDALLPEAEKAAQQRMKAGKKITPSGQWPRDQEEPSGQWPKGQDENPNEVPSGQWPKGGESGRALDQIAAITGTSRRTLQRIKTISTEGGQEIIEQIERGELSIGAAEKQLREKGSGKQGTPGQADKAVTFEATIKLKNGTVVRVSVISEKTQLTKTELKEAFSKALNQ